MWEFSYKRLSLIVVLIQYNCTNVSEQYNVIKIKRSISMRYPTDISIIAVQQPSKMENIQKEPFENEADY